MRTAFSTFYEVVAPVSRAAIFLLIVVGSTSIYSQADILSHITSSKLPLVTKTALSPSSLSPTVLAATHVSLAPAFLAEEQASTAQTIKLTATDPDGTNTGNARLGVPVHLKATVSAGPYGTVNWKLQGSGGHIDMDDQTATYNPPQSMPSSSKVVITAYLQSHPSTATSYTISLGNPVPAVSAKAVTPAHLLTGGTQTLALVGTGFVAKTVVLYNGATFPVTFKDYDHATVRVPVSPTASGAITLQVKNPGPGGGSGTKFTEAIAANSIHITATNQDGASTNTAGLGTAVHFSAKVSGSAQTAANWKISGAGSLSSSAVYTAPASMPGNHVVTMTASLASNPKVTTSYQLTLVNPVPIIASVNPTNIVAGKTTTVNLAGSGFVSDTVVRVNGNTVASALVSPTSMVARIGVASNSTGELSVQAANPSPAGGDGPSVTEAVAAPVSVAAAARILDQTTFGPTTSLIEHVQSEGITAWLAGQFNTPATHLALLPNAPAPNPAYCSKDASACLASEWWQAALTGNDQLRQRVAFALSEIFVVSVDSVLAQDIPPYANMLADDAFTNWRTIMQDVTLSPAMAIYLNLLDSAKPGSGEIANENYARENMQLFNLGLNLLNQDGTSVLDSNNNPKPTYTEAQVQAFARAYTGWTYAPTNGSAPVGWTPVDNPNHSLEPFEPAHDTAAKTLLNGTTLSAGQSAAEDLNGALDNIFEHQNLPPFVCKQLIQHLVTGNPSPAYVSRIAAVFIDDGNHVRGNMKAVLTAIFTDKEARAGDTSSTAPGGHLREPILWMTNVMRGLGYVNIDPYYHYRFLSDYSSTLGTKPYAASSVFNFFPPNYVIPGTQTNSPEFSLENTGSVADRLSLADTMVSNNIRSFNVDLSATSPLGQMASNPADLVDALGVIFMHGQMDSTMRTTLINEVKTITNLGQRVRIAAYLVITSSQYKIMH